MQYGFNSTLGPETTDSMIGEIRSFSGSLTQSEQDGILNVYERLSEKFLEHADTYACLLAEYTPGTTLSLFGPSEASDSG